MTASIIKTVDRFPQSIFIEAKQFSRNSVHFEISRELVRVVAQIGIAPDGAASRERVRVVDQIGIVPDGAASWERVCVVAQIGVAPDGAASRERVRVASQIGVAPEGAASRERVRVVAQIGAAPDGAASRERVRVVAQIGVAPDGAASRERLIAANHLFYAFHFVLSVKSGEVLELIPDLAVDATEQVAAALSGFAVFFVLFPVHCSSLVVIGACLAHIAGYELDKQCIEFGMGPGVDLGLIPCPECFDIGAEFSALVFGIDEIVVGSVFNGGGPRRIGCILADLMTRC